MKPLSAEMTGWWMGMNPLLGLSLERAQQIHDAARRGCSPLLHRVYDAIEAADPVLMTCVERRSSALAGLGWHSTARAGVDDGLAKEQRQFIDDLADGIGDLEEALEHLDLAFFRGFSHVQPVWEGGRVRRIQTLDSWNFMRRADGTWLWNPEAKEGDGEGLEEITPEARLVTVRRPRAIDYPAMAIHIRKALGERDWGRFVERFGIPPVNVVMAPGTTEEQRADYVKVSQDAQDGCCAVWPSGSSVSYAEGARGQDPFSAFQEHQERLVVLMATGGTLTSLAQADTGSLAGGAQMDVWEEIVRRDAKIIGAALDRALFRPAVEAAFPGRPVAAQFELGTEATPSTAEVFETAGKARAAGYRVAQEELEEASGYSLVPDDVGSLDRSTVGSLGGGAMFNRKGRTIRAANDSTVKRSNGRTEGRETAVASPLLAAFARDTGAAAERMAALLDKLDAGEDVAADARKLADELPGLMRGEPQLAAVLEEEMAKAFAGEVEGRKSKVESRELEEALANAAERVPPGHGNGGQFTGKTNPPEGGEESPKAREKREKREKQEKAFAAGQAGMKALDGGQDCPNFMPGVQTKSFSVDHVAFRQGDEGGGYVHIKTHGPNKETGNNNHQAMLEGDKIPRTLAYGTWYEEGGGYVAIDEDRRVVMGKEGKGVFILTAYEEAERENERTRQRGKRVWNEKVPEGAV